MAGSSPPQEWAFLQALFGASLIRRDINLIFWLSGC